MAMMGAIGFTGRYEKMKTETLRRLRNILKILSRGEIGTEIWETGYYQQIFWGGPDEIRPKIARYGKVKLL